jgi:hypothetical protein
MGVGGMGGMQSMGGPQQTNPPMALVPTSGMDSVTGFEHVQQTGTGETIQDVQAKQMIMQFGGMILKALADGKSGDTFAFDVMNLFGMEPILYLKQFQPEQVIAHMKQVPEFWQRCAHLEGPLTTFITEFLSFDPKNIEEGEET